MPSRHDGPKVIVWGRCRSGTRWFWVATDFSSDQPRHVHYRADTEAEAVAMALDEVDVISEAAGAFIHKSHAHARSVLKEINAEKRRARPASDSTDTAPVEYLYGIWFDDNCRQHLRSFPITKKTASRVYYRRPHDDSIGFVDRRELEAKGSTWKRSGGWWDADHRLFLEPPDLDPAAPAAVGREELARLRAAAVEAHPDRGGSNEAFAVAHRRYMVAKHGVRLIRKGTTA